MRKPTNAQLADALERAARILGSIDAWKAAYGANNPDTNKLPDTTMEVAGFHGMIAASRGEKPEAQQTL